MECKLFITQNESYLCCELIDTLWNVNKNTMELKEIESIELIDTLWNVNWEQP